MHVSQISFEKADSFKGRKQWTQLLWPKYFIDMKRPTPFSIYSTDRLTRAWKFWHVYCQEVLLLLFFCLFFNLFFYFGTRYLSVVNEIMKIRFSVSHISIPKHTHTQTRARAHTHTHTHKYTHTHTHTHTHTVASTRKLRQTCPGA